jgi:cytochrome c biogenesis protein CcmG, thiol:disulfide interchange protein DsbE
MVTNVRGASCVVAAVLAAGLGAAGSLAAQDDVGLPLGTQPAAVTLQDLDGNPAVLGTRFDKQPVLVEFWATWCPRCAALQPKLTAAHARYGDRVQFVAVAVAVSQRPSTIKRHLAEHPIPYPVLWDADGQAVRNFAAPTTSYVVVLDSSGKVAYTGTGEDQDIEAVLGRLVKKDGIGR